MDNLYIAITGNISAGKSTLTKVLAEKFKAKAVFEPVAENPYLADFYKDMKRWAFHSQMFFLSQRLKDQYLLSKKKGVFIQDRTIYEDAEIFARNLFEKGFIEKRDWNVYQDFYQNISDLLPKPDLIVYLKNSVPTIQKRIKLRGRKFEQKINKNYLLDLNRLYDEWAINFSTSKRKIPFLIILLDNLNYLKNPEKLEQIIELILEKLGRKAGKISLK